MPTRRSTKFSLAWYIVVLSSLFAAIILYCDFDRPDYYFLLPLLPFTFAIINIAVVKTYENIYKNIGVVLVMGLYYCRIVIVPVIMSIGNYSSLQKYNVFQNMPSAIFLMIYELIISYIVLYLTAGRSGCIENESTAANINGRISTKAFKTIIVCILLFDIAVFIFIPESRRLYTDIFKAMQQTDYEIFYIDDVISRGSLKRACVTLYLMIMEFVRIFVPAYFIISIRKKSGEKLIGIIQSIPFILVQFLLVSNTQANSILCSLVLMLLIAKLYPSWSAKIYRFSLMSGILFVVCYFAFKHKMPSSLYGGMTMGERASQLANAYFSGPDNIAAVFNVTTKDKWAPFFYTLISSIPFNGTIFGIKGSNFSSLYNYYNGSLFQIAPCIGESYFYFGAVLSPIVPGFFVNLAIRCGRRIQMKINLWKYVTYVYFILLLAISPVMYNGAIFLKTFMETILPMMILSNLSDD
jgi:hypothetical protein